MKRILMVIILLAGVAQADDYKLLCEHGEGAVDSINTQANALMKQGYEISGPHSHCWFDLGDRCEISICQSMVKKDKKIAKVKPEIKHEYWVVRNEDAKAFAADVEAMLNEGWKLSGSISSSTYGAYNYLVQALVKDTEVKPEEKKP